MSLKGNKIITGFRGLAGSAVLLAAISGCTAASIASLGGDTAGGRGKIGVIFINNTSNQAQFTVGTYDPLDPASQPDVSQFGLAAADDQLNANSSSKLVQLDCAHVFSIGGSRMLRLIDLNVVGSNLDQAALVDGVEFFTPAAQDQSAGSAGSAPAFEALLGEDFSCGSLLIVYFEANDAGGSPFRADFQLIPARSNR